MEVGIGLIGGAVAGLILGYLIVSSILKKQGHTRIEEMKQKKKLKRKSLKQSRKMSRSSNAKFRMLSKSSPS